MPHKSNGETDGQTSGIEHSFRHLVGYDTVLWEEGRSEIRLVISAKHMNRQGKVHGGLYATILDAAMGHAVTWCPVPGHSRGSVTVSLTTQYLQGISSGTLIASATLEGVDGRVATARGEVRSSTGLLCALGQASFLYSPGSERLEGVALAPRNG
jgi:uncharacterized protein (TIGR00369 family)